MNVPMAIIIIVIKNNNNERQWRDAALFTWFQVCFRKPLPPSLFLRSEVTQTRVVSWSRPPIRFVWFWTHLCLNLNQPLHVGDMFNVLRQPLPRRSVCKKSIVVNAYCAYSTNSNSQIHPEPNTNRKRCKVCVKGEDFRELMGIADKQRQLDRAVEMTSTRLQASLDKQLNKQAAISQVRFPSTEGPSKRQKPPCQEGRYKPREFSTPPSSEVSNSN